MRQFEVISHWVVRICVVGLVACFLSPVVHVMTSKARKHVREDKFVAPIRDTLLKDPEWKGWEFVKTHSGPSNALMVTGTVDSISVSWQQQMFQDLHKIAREFHVSVATSFDHGAFVESAQAIEQNRRPTSRLD